MKRTEVISGIFLITLLLSGCSRESSSPHRKEIVALFNHDGIYHIGNCVVGVAGDEHEFYLLAQKISKSGSEEEFWTMIADPNPAVRIMGLVCLRIATGDSPIIEDDKQEVDVFAWGCNGDGMTVTEFSMRLREDIVFAAGFTKSTDEAIELMIQESEKGNDNT